MEVSLAAGDTDRFRLEAKKGTPLWIDCLAERLGNASDPLLIVERILRSMPKATSSSAKCSRATMAATRAGVTFHCQPAIPPCASRRRKMPPIASRVMNQTGSGRSRQPLSTRDSGTATLTLRTRRHRLESPIANRSCCNLCPTLLRQGWDRRLSRSWRSGGDGFRGEIALSAEGSPGRSHLSPDAESRKDQDSATFSF